MRLYAWFVLLVMCCMPVAAHAVGGIYFDDFRVTNNGSTVFSDSFDDGNINDWTSKDWATITSEVSYSSSYSLHLNHRNVPWSVVSEAFHTASISTPGVVEASSMVWLPDVQEQYQPSFTNICLYSGNTTNNIFAGVTMRSGDSGYRVWLGWNGGSNPRATTNSVVLAPQTWARLTLRIDRTNSTAYALLNDQTQLSFYCDPDSFASFNRTSVWGWLGDENGTAAPEPSSLLALLSGVGGLGVWKFRRGAGRK